MELLLFVIYQLGVLSGVGLLIYIQRLHGLYDDETNQRN